MSYVTDFKKAKTVFARAISPKKVSKVINERGFEGALGLAEKALRSKLREQLFEAQSTLYGVNQEWMPKLNQKWMSQTKKDQTLMDPWNKLMQAVGTIYGEVKRELDNALERGGMVDEPMLKPMNHAKEWQGEIDRFMVVLRDADLDTKKRLKLLLVAAKALKARLTELSKWSVKNDAEKFLAVAGKFWKERGVFLKYAKRHGENEANSLEIRRALLKWRSALDTGSIPSRLKNQEKGANERLEWLDETRKFLIQGASLGKLKLGKVRR